MGKELTPLNLFGAVLGAGAGVGYYFATAPFMNPYLTYATPLIYAGTGVLTNHIAIKMLFQPYEEKKFLGLKLPFTPGVVEKNKPHFAKNTSKFVKNGILSDEALKEVFNNHKENLKILLDTNFSKNNYQKIKNYSGWWAEDNQIKIYIRKADFPQWVGQCRKIKYKILAWR